MSVSGTTKELSKAITAFIPSASLPLPEDLTRVIEAYLGKHTLYDQAASDRLQDELLSIYNKFVHGNPARYAPFLAILHPLRPAIRSLAHILHWWDKFVEPVLDNLGQEKGLADEALANIESILIYQDNDQEDLGNAANPLAERLVAKWMELFQIVQLEGNTTAAFKAKVLRQTLLLFGKKRPKIFFLVLDGFLLKKEYRSRSFNLLSEFIQSQPPHLHLVLQTPLFDNIIRCIQTDTSTTIVSLALTCLIMLLPNMPSSIVSFLPTLFNIYARLLFWDREISTAIRGSTTDITPQNSPNSTWAMCPYSPDNDGATIPHLLGYFTMLYGLYPINFMDYIRKPQRYLRHANVANADDIEVQPSEIRHRSERYRQWHLLHPNFYSLTMDSEKTDFSRWIKSETPDVVAECVALCLPTDTGNTSFFDSMPLPGRTSPFISEDMEKDGQDHALLSGSMTTHSLSTHDSRLFKSTMAGSPSSSRAQSALIRQSSQSSHPSTRDSVETRTREPGGDSPTLPPHLALSGSHTQLQDMIDSNKAIKSSIHQSLANDSVPSLALSHHESIAEKSSVRLSANQQLANASSSGLESADQIADLQRQVLLLKNDLNFERYMKQQHMTHIGTLRRAQVREAASEAETQTLIMNNRNLKQRLEEAKRAEMQAKKESEKSRTMAKKWESDLSTKLRNLREEQKKWNSEGAAVKRDLEAAREESGKLRQLVCDAEVKELNAKQIMQSIENDDYEMGKLRGEVDRLKETEQENQVRKREMESVKREATEAERQMEALRMKLMAREGELQRTINYYESQIVVLNTKLADAHGSRQDKRSSTDMNSMVESALAASRARQLELQKQHSQLMRKYTVLQSSLLDMQSNTSPVRSRTNPSASSDADAEVSAIVGRPLTSLRTRGHRGFSDPETFDGLSYNTPPALESFGSGGSPGGGSNRPKTPPGQMRLDDSGANTSPQNERYHGRGGVQNTIRKERKEKKKEEPEKKEKKSTGIRGIRGFV